MAAEQLRAPDNFPPEIVLDILRHILVREGEKTGFLRPKKSLDQAYLIQSSIDSPTAGRPYPYNNHSDEQPPMERHTSPSINGLEISKVFRDEDYNFFYRHNVSASPIRTKSWTVGRRLSDLPGVQAPRCDDLGECEAAEEVERHSSDRRALPQPSDQILIKRSQVRGCPR